MDRDHARKNRGGEEQADKESEEDVHDCGVGRLLEWLRCRAQRWLGVVSVEESELEGTGGRLYIQRRSANGANTIGMLKAPGWGRV